MSALADLLHHVAAPVWAFLVWVVSFVGGHPLWVLVAWVVLGALVLVLGPRGTR